MGRLIEVIHSRLAKAAERIEGLISKIRVLLDYPSDQWSQYWQLKRSQVRGKVLVTVSLTCGRCAHFPIGCPPENERGRSPASVGRPDELFFQDLRNKRRFKNLPVLRDGQALQAIQLPVPGPADIAGRDVLDRQAKLSGVGMGDGLTVGLPAA